MIAVLMGSSIGKQKSMTSTSISEDEIRAKAYDLWEFRGRGDGNDKADWYAAKIILTQGTYHGQKLYPPYFAYISKKDIFERLRISHIGISDFFGSSNSWIETTTHPETIFEYDRNRRLHFDEGFLCACYRILKNTNISFIASEDHFPYRDLLKFRERTKQLVELYRQGRNLPPPLFFYPTPYQLEILDGVHRCLAAFELVQRKGDVESHFVPACFRIWVGFNHDSLRANIVVHQLWISSIFHIQTDHSEL